MAFVNAMKHVMLDAINTTPSAVTTNTVYASLHTADPGATGTSEVTGGSPAYARKGVNMSVGASGQRVATNQPIFDVSASTTVTYVGFWTAVTSGTWLGSSSVTSEAFGSQGTYTLTAVTFSIT